MEIIFRAYDRTEFSTKEECENYEKSYLKNDNIIMIDEQGCKSNFENCIFFRCLSIEAAKSLYNRFCSRQILPWDYIEDVDTKLYFLTDDGWVEFPLQAAKALIEIDESMEEK